MPELHLRLTTSNFTIEEVRAFVKALSPDKYIIGQETSPYNHYHCHFNYDCASFTNYQKRKLGKIVTTHFNLTEGNKNYGISQDRGKSEIYTLKDGSYVYEGYTEDEIRILYSQSETKLGFKDILKTLREQYLDNQLDFNQYVTGYITAHVDSLKPLSDFRVESHIRTMFLSKNPQSIDAYANSMIRKAETWNPYN